MRRELFQFVERLSFLAATHRDLSQQRVSAGINRRHTLEVLGSAVDLSIFKYKRPPKQVVGRRRVINCECLAGQPGGCRILLFAEVYLNQVKFGSGPIRIDLDAASEGYRARR